MSGIKAGDVDPFHRFILVPKAGENEASLLRRADNGRCEGDQVIVENLHTGYEESVHKDEPVLIVHV